MKNKIAIIIFSMLFFVPVLFAQEQMGQFNYNQQELFVNPAYAGSQGMFSGSFGYLKQWTDIEGAPNAQRLQVHSPFFNDKVGFGLSFHREGFGVTNSYNISTHYAYRIKLEKGTLSLGLQLGLAAVQEDLASLSTGDPSDIMFNKNTKTMLGFSTGVGAYYSTADYYIGLSAPYLINNAVTTGEKLVNKIELDKTPFYLTGGYLFKLDPNFKLKPTALLRYSGEQKFGYNVGLTAFYREKVWIGALARYDHQLGGQIGFNVANHLNLSYTCAFSYGELYAKRGVIHEVGLNVLFNFKENKSGFKFF